MPLNSNTSNCIYLLQYLVRNNTCRPPTCLRPPKIQIKIKVKVGPDHAPPPTVADYVLIGRRLNYLINGKCQKINKICGKCHIYKLENLPIFALARFTYIVHISAYLFGRELQIHWHNIYV